jgi:hypothetical protein
MTRKRRWLKAAAPLLLAPLLCAGLRPAASDPSAESTGKVVESYVALRDFLSWTDQARPEELDQRAKSFNPLQIPLLAQVVDEAERELAAPDPSTYRALVRWQFWLSRQLDADNRGAWEARPEVLPKSMPITRGTTAILPALEMTQLTALAGMAFRSDHLFDALIWWRDRDLVESRIARNIYDPSTGGYAGYDSLGHRQQHPPHLADLVPVALNAPCDRGASLRLAYSLLAGGEVDDVNDARAKAWMSQTLDPSSGWPLQPGLDLLRPDQTSILLSRAVALLGDAELNDLLRGTLQELDLPYRGPLVIDLGDQRVSIPTASANSDRLQRSRVAVEFLLRAHVFDSEETRTIRLALQNAQDHLDDAPDSVATMLQGWADRWQDFDVRERQAVHPREFDEQGLNGSDATAAFSFRERDTAQWLPTALQLLRRDASELLYQSRPGASYSAQILPGVITRDHRPTLHLHFDTVSAAEREIAGDWRVAWTDGHETRAFAPVSLVAQGRLSANATLPKPPEEPGLWWIVIRGPAGGPKHAPACSVVDPMRATVLALPKGNNHARSFQVSLENALTGELDGRYEIVVPSDFEVQPAASREFSMPARSTSTWVVQIIAPENKAPGDYPVEWRFYDDHGLTAQLHESFAVHFNWLTIGPFAPGESSPLATSAGPDFQVRLGQSYHGLKGNERWTHVDSRALTTDGWVILGQGTPGAIWYGLTAVSTATRDALVKLESSTDALLRVNGSEIGRTHLRHDSLDTSLQLSPGTNYLLVKVAADEKGLAKIRLGLQDITGTSLFAADYELKSLVDGYAYLGSAPATSGSSPEEQTRVEMRLVPITYRDSNASSVAVVGSFNGWSPRANLLRRGSDGLWRTEIRLRPGSFQYKLVVDGTRWIADPANPSRVSDGFGSLNSVLVVR